MRTAIRRPPIVGGGDVIDVSDGIIYTLKFVQRCAVPNS